MSRAHCASSRSRTLGDPTSAVPMQLQRSSLLSKTTIRATHREIHLKPARKLKGQDAERGKEKVLEKVLREAMRATRHLTLELLGHALS